MHRNHKHTEILKGFITRSKCRTTQTQCLHRNVINTLLSPLDRETTKLDNNNNQRCNKHLQNIHPKRIIHILLNSSGNVFQIWPLTKIKQLLTNLGKLK